MIGSNSLFWVESNGNSLIWILNSTMNWISSFDWGSIVYAYSTNANVEIIDSNITENSAMYGAVFYSTFESKVYFENSLL